MATSKDHQAAIDKAQDLARSLAYRRFITADERHVLQAGLRGAEAVADAAPRGAPTGWSSKAPGFALIVLAGLSSMMAGVLYAGGEAWLSLYLSALAGWCMGFGVADLRAIRTPAARFARYSSARWVDPLAGRSDAAPFGLCLATPEGPIFLRVTRQEAETLRDVIDGRLLQPNLSHWPEKSLSTEGVA